MERRYLVASLALIATFAGFTRGFDSLQQVSQQGKNISGQQCPMPSILSRVLGRIKGNLHQTDPEEAQVLAEMNLPMAASQAKAAEEAAKQSQAAAEAARGAARREADRAHREALTMRKELAHQRRIAATMVSIEIPDYAMNRRIQVQTAAMAQRLAAEGAKMQVTAAKWQAQAASWQKESSAKRFAPCGVSSTRQMQ